MTDRVDDRRGFLKLAGGTALGAGLLPPAIARALALPAARRTGTLRDIEHVVILMQENRSFDHYFGTLAGVRGFGDPRPIELPGGQPVWRQPGKVDGAAVGPFHLDTRATRAETMFSLDHSWKGSHTRWKRHDAWIAAKGPLTMGYFSRADIPFYYALADAFTICDAYHCSIFGPTNPNRLFLFSGTSGLAVGEDSAIVTTNPPGETSYAADPAKDSPGFTGLTWTTYAERLQAAGIGWKVYQEHENYGDNALSYFANFRGIGPKSPLYQKGRAWAPGSGPETDKTSQGEHLVAQFAADAAADRLPQVSWIVPPYRLSEHPAASPSDGEHLTARLIGALTANPKVWAKTVFILNYDENDGFFDHVPPPLPATGSAPGKSTVPTTGENFHGEPVGLGPRVPMIVVSPWTKGGFVNSQVFDHTSVIRLLEARFGVAEPNITPWRRAVCGDLTSVFDFATPDAPPPALPDTTALPAGAKAAMTLPYPKPVVEAALHQEPGTRPARALPYEFQTTTHYDPDGLLLTLSNTGQAGVTFNLYPGGHGEPRFYTLGLAGYLTDVLALEAGPYALALHGPNGFLCLYRGDLGPAASQRPEANAWFQAPDRSLHVALHNEGPDPITLDVTALAYAKTPRRRYRLAPGAERIIELDLRASHHWYDVQVTCLEAPGFLRRFAGHGEDGRPSLSDPAFGA